MYMSQIVRKPVRYLGFLTKSDTNRALQMLKMARGLKFPSCEIKGLYYLFSENKGADQLCSYRVEEADFLLMWLICERGRLCRTLQMIKLITEFLSETGFVMWQLIYYSKDSDQPMYLGFK